MIEAAAWWSYAAVVERDRLVGMVDSGVGIVDLEVELVVPLVGPVDTVLVVAAATAVLADIFLVQIAHNPVGRVVSLVPVYTGTLEVEIVVGALDTCSVRFPD